MKKALLSVVGALMVVACATDSSYQKTTAGFIACAADDIQISDVNTSGANSWKAICRSNARIYTCSQDGCTELR
jgi:hypothetical protein